MGMPSARQPAAKPAATIINATAKTRSVIEGLQARLTRTPEPPPVEESVDDLEQQLQAYFERAAPAAPRGKILDELRSRVIDGVVDRILAQWANPELGSPGAGLGPEVMERLIERVLEEFSTAAESPKTPGESNPAALRTST
jgi:hypothetical protein